MEREFYFFSFTTAIGLDNNFPKYPVGESGGLIDYRFFILERDSSERQKGCVAPYFSEIAHIAEEKETVLSINIHYQLLKYSSDSKTTFLLSKC